MTPILKGSLEYLKEVRSVKRIKEYPSKPHWFTGINEEIEVENGWLKSPKWNRTINRQSLNRLVSLGHARYTDKSKDTAIYISEEEKQRYAMEKAMENFDKWNDVAGVFEKDTGSYWEIESIIEDSIRIGMKIAENGIGASLDFLEEE